MEFEQKAEEKKMSMSKNIARLAVTAGLTAALSFGGVMAPVTMAFAEGAATTTNSIKINKIDGNESVKYKAYQIFKADVVDGKDGSGKVVSNVEWAVNDATQSAIIEAINTYASNNASNQLNDNPSAQDVANWLKDNFNSYGDTTIVGKDNVFNTLAKIVQQKVNPAKPNGFTEASFPANQPVSFSGSGYYLFLTDSNSISKKDETTKKPDTGTSPIFAVIGGNPVTVTEKTSIPTVNKAVHEDSDDRWTINGSDILTSPNKGADSAMDDWVDYKLVGTVASNIDTYSDYKYVFTDKLPNSMTPKFVDGSGNNVPDVTVKIDNQIVKKDTEHGYTKSFSADNVLTVGFKNLKDCVDVKDNPIAVNADSKVTVEYKAKLDSSKIFDSNNVIMDEFQGLIGKAQKNTVKLEYSNNPHGEGIGATVDHFAYDYTYGIDVTKVGSDKDENDKYPALENVEFTLQEVVGGSAQEQYIDAKGVKHIDAKDALLKTDQDGKISVVGLDEGTYILKEVTPAPGYNNSAKDGVTFIIKRSLNQTGQDVKPSTDSAITAGGNVVQNGSATATTGKLSFTIVDQKGSGLPLTGLNGVTFTWIAGGAVLCIGVAHLIRSRKQAEESEQE